MSDIPAWTVAVGNISLRPKYWKSNREFFRTLREECEGYLGIHPMEPHGTLLLFESLNDAKIARNILTAKGIQCGRNICEVCISEEYKKERKNDAD